MGPCCLFLKKVPTHTHSLSLAATITIDGKEEEDGRACLEWQEGRRRRRRAKWHSLKFHKYRRRRDEKEVGTFLWRQRTTFLGKLRHSWQRLLLHQHAMATLPRQSERDKERFHTPSPPPLPSSSSKCGIPNRIRAEVAAKDREGEGGGEVHQKARPEAQGKEGGPPRSSSSLAPKVL